MDLKTMSASVEKLTLREPMTLEALNRLLLEKWDGPGRFKLKKGLFGKSIQFDTVMQLQPRLTVKDSAVIVRKVSNSTRVGFGGGPMIDYKDTKQRVSALKEGSAKAAAFGGHENFERVCEKIKEILRNRMV